MPEVLTTRALNRALLERQLQRLDELRAGRDAIEHLVGMQAQVPTSPYAGLWSRIDGFATDDLAQLVLDGRVVRIVLMRSTIHLATAADAGVLRAVVAPMLAKDPYARGVSVDDVVRATRTIVEAQPRTPSDLGRLLADAMPGHGVDALVHASRAFVPLVQVPPRGVWGVGGQVRLTTLSSFVGDAADDRASVDDVVVRYLRAFGPASVKDFSAWSRLTGMRAVFERLRPQLRVDRDEHGTELFDVVDAPIAAPDVVAPVRFLPEYDNVLLAHADRSRILDDRARSFLSRENGYWPFVLVDGDVRATWSRRDGTITIAPFDDLTPRQRDDVLEEGQRLAAALDADSVSFSGGGRS